MSEPRRKMGRWLWQIAFWSGYALLHLVFHSYAKGFHWKPALYSLLAGIAGLACTVPLRTYIKRHNWIALPARQLIPRIALASVGVAACIMGLFTLSVIYVFRILSPSDVTWTVLLLKTCEMSTTVLTWILIYLSVHYFKRYKAAEIEALNLKVAAQEAQFRALRSQVNPHFLFNCLNGLRGLILEDPQRAQAVVTRLSGLLRYGLQSDRAETVPLRHEMDAVNDYLALESMRFEERLRVSINVNPETLSARVPPMLLQTLVENGLKHGLARLPQGGELAISTGLLNGTLRIEVVNSGQLGEVGDSTRVGLRNARERLRMLFGDAACLTVENRDDASVVAVVSLPFQKAEEAA